MNGRPAEQSEAAAPAAKPEIHAPVLLNRRRLAVVFGGLLALWLVGVFARQVGDAAAAANQADQMRARNAAMAQDIQSLQAELQLIQQPAFQAEMARGYLLGTPLEVPFTVDKSGQPLPSNAPGSVGIQPAAPDQEPSPYDAWMQALFGGRS